MSITHREFFRLLPRAIDGKPCRQSGNTLIIDGAPGSIRISLSSESVRRLGGLNLPVTRMRLELDGFSDAQAREFLRRFDRAYQKGGG